MIDSYENKKKIIKKSEALKGKNDYYKFKYICDSLLSLIPGSLKKYHNNSNM